MRSRRFFLVFLLFAFCLLAMVVAGLNTRKPIKKRMNSKKSEELRVICPHLNECADAFLLYNQFGSMMIDTGEKADGDLLLNLLKEKEIDSLDLLVLTHFDKDHIGGAPAILSQIPVKTCYMPVSNETGDIYEEVMEALKANGTEIVFLTEPVTLNKLSADITISPPLSMTYKDSTENNVSLITSVKYQSSALLFMGDAEKERVGEYFLNQYDYTDYDFVKMPHHGRDKRSTEYILYVLDPEDALITSSKEEPEDSEVLQMLKENNVKVWLTRDGSVDMTVDGEGMTLSQ